MGGTVSLCITAVAALFGVIGLLIGLRRGFNRAIVRLFLLAVSAIAALLLTYPVTKAVSGTLLEKAFTLLDQSVEKTFGELLACSPTLEALVPELVTALLSVLTFGLLFILIALLMLIPYAIIFSGSRRKDENGKPRRPGVLGSIGGLLIGAVAGLFVFAVLIAPLTGISEYCERVLHYMNEEELEMLPDGVDEALLRDINNCIPVSVVRECGGRYVTETLLTLHMPDGNVKLSDEIENTIDMLRVVSSANEEGTSPADLLRSLADFTSKDSIASSALAEVLPSAAEKWKNGENFLGVSPEDLGLGEDNSLSPVIDLAFETLSSSTKETLGEDFGTAAELLDIVQPFVKEHGEVTPEAIFGSDLIPQVLEKLSDNEHFSGMTEDCVSTVIRTLDIDPASLDDEFCVGAAAAMSVAASTSDTKALAASVGQALESVNIKASSEALDSIAKFFRDTYGGRTFTPADIRTLLTEGKV